MNDVLVSTLSTLVNALSNKIGNNVFTFSFEQTCTIRKNIFANLAIINEKAYDEKCSSKYKVYIDIVENEKLTLTINFKKSARLFLQYFATSHDKRYMTNIKNWNGLLVRHPL